MNKESINVDNLNKDLVKASKHGVYKLVELLLDAGADIHAWNDFALRWASDRGYYNVVELLLDRGADIHTWDDRALRWASDRGYYNVVELLLDRGADATRVRLYSVSNEEVKQLILDAKRKVA